MFSSFRIAKAKNACVTALRPLLARAAIAEQWPPQFWRDPYVLGFFVGTIASIGDMATRPKKLTSEQGGQVMIDTFKELGGYAPDLVERIERLARDRDADYWQGVKNAEKLIVYTYGGTSFGGVSFDQDADVKAATDIAKGSGLGGGVGREAISGSLLYLLFNVPVKRRLGR